MAILLTELPGEPMLRAEDATHVKVYYEAGRYGGWPANHGIWSWGDEILVGFSRGYYKDLGPTRHAIDREKPEEFWLARSLDGGETWTSFATENATPDRWVYWQFGYVPEQAGTYQLSVRARTQSGLVSPLAANVVFTVEAPSVWAGL